MDNLISAADVFVDREIFQFAEGEAVSDLESEIIAAFLNVRPPPLVKIADLLGEGKYGEVADQMAYIWDVQFKNALSDALTSQLQLAGDATAQELGDDGFGVKEMITVATEQFAVPAVVRAPIFNPTDPKVASWIEGRVGAILGSLEDDAREIVSEAITRGAAGELTERQVARVIAEHVGLNPRRAKAVENYRKFLTDFRARTDMERLIKRRPKYIKERLQKGGFKRKEWRLIREQGAKKALKNRRLDVMAKDYAERLRKERALDIARTEVAMARSRGKELAWEQAQADGVLLPGAMRKWRTRKDAKVCKKYCKPMHGKLAPIGGVWHTPRGDVSVPNEIHTKCRCDEILVAKPTTPMAPRRRKPRRHLGPRKKKKTT